MVRFKRRNLLFLLILIIVCSCGTQKSEENVQEADSVAYDSNSVSLQFFFEINKELYQQTNFGEPPQLAIWIENPDSSVVKTVWITHRTARQDWKGKIECPVSLPYWEYRIFQEGDKTETKDNRNSTIDAVSQATPKEGRLIASILVPPTSQWDYYIEVNVSADYNKTFTYWSQDGLPDSEANGQPSIVYSGRILADGKSHSTPVLSGRTDQRHAVNRLSGDLSGITTAKYLIGNLQVKSTPD